MPATDGSDAVGSCRRGTRPSPGPVRIVTLTGRVLTPLLALSGGECKRGRRPPCGAGPRTAAVRPRSASDRPSASATRPTRRPAPGRRAAGDHPSSGSRRASARPGPRRRRPGGPRAAARRRGRRSGAAGSRWPGGEVHGDPAERHVAGGEDDRARRGARRRRRASSVAPAEQAGGGLRPECSRGPKRRPTRKVRRRRGRRRPAAASASRGRCGPSPATATAARATTRPLAGDRGTRASPDGDEQRPRAPTGPPPGLEDDVRVDDDASREVVLRAVARARSHARAQERSRPRSGWHRRARPWAQRLARSGRRMTVRRRPRPSECGACPSKVARIEPSASEVTGSSRSATNTACASRAGLPSSSSSTSCHAARFGCSTRGARPGRLQGLHGGGELGARDRHGGGRPVVAEHGGEHHGGQRRGPRRGALTWENTHSGDDDAGLRPTACATGGRQPSIRAARWSRIAARPSGVLQSRSLTAASCQRAVHRPPPGAGEQRVNSATRLGEVEVAPPHL